MVPRVFSAICRLAILVKNNLARLSGIQLFFDHHDGGGGAISKTQVPTYPHHVGNLSHFSDSRIKCHNNNGNSQLYQIISIRCILFVNRFPTKTKEYRGNTTAVFEST
jgi:hypothetical protein